MLSTEDRARVARENGSKSRGPKTEAGKEKSRRNAIKHGDRADALKLLVPPHSACLMHDERLAYYELFDRNIAKYRAGDEAEKEIVREITALQWANGRNRLVLNAMLNREILRTGAALQPTDESTFNIDNTVAAYEGVAANPAVRQLHLEYRDTVRLIGTLERRLIKIQKHWPAEPAQPVNSNPERRQFGIPETVPPPETAERTQPAGPETIENKPKKRKKIVNVTAPLTPEKIRLYQQVFPNRDLEFNVYEPEPKAA